jgi:hypothetical protein
MTIRPDEAHIADICETNLRGSLAPDDRGQMTPFPRLIDAKMIEAAPILRGREGEDVCSPPPLYWWDKPLIWIIKLTGMD